MCFQLLLNHCLYREESLALNATKKCLPFPTISYIAFLNNNRDYQRQIESNRQAGRQQYYKEAYTCKCKQLLVIYGRSNEDCDDKTENIFLRNLGSCIAVKESSFCSLIYLRVL